MKYKVCELRIQYTILSKYGQNTRFIQIAPCFRWSFHCFGMLQVRENEISLRNTSGGPEYLRTLQELQTSGISSKAINKTLLHKP